MAARWEAGHDQYPAVAGRAPVEAERAAGRALAKARLIALVDWPSPTLPRGLVQAGFSVVSLNRERDTASAYAWYRLPSEVPDDPELTVFAPAEPEDGYLVCRRLDGWPGAADLLSVYRPAEEQPDLVRLALRLGAKSFWVEPGATVSGEAREAARAAGLLFVEGLSILEAARGGFASMRLPGEPDLLAPDGSEVRVLLAMPGGSMAHFRLSAGQVSAAVRHRRVDEIWYVLSGRGDLWRRWGGREDTASLEPGTCLTIPAGTEFQFRAAPQGPLNILGVTMPAWPGPEEAEPAPGPWA